MRNVLVLLAVLAAACSPTVGPPPPPPPPSRFYVANFGSSTISAFTIADTGNATPALTISGGNTTLDSPEGVVVDPAGVLITTSANPWRIVVFGTNAVGDVAPVATIAGGNTRLSHPTGLALDQAARLYVANKANNVITVFAAGATGNARPVDTIAGPNTGLNAPLGIVIDPGGRLYVANSGTSAATSSITVYEAGASGNVTPIRTIAGATTGLDQPQGIGLDGGQRIYAASSAFTSHLYRITVYPGNADGDVAPVKIGRAHV